jgi:hypothetical protein
MVETRRDAEQAIGHSIDGFYNPVRRHSALGFTSPAQVARMAVNGSNASPLNRSKSRLINGAHGRPSDCPLARCNRPARPPSRLARLGNCPDPSCLGPSAS